ncbi:adhesion G protein-coupled receptor F4 isoform X3 [Entelurus aequoreus]|uniref:adhesion G protein-coupled receptor F4 isoform X3 n=1 Tax=Entelurus aequoreus TaxID=161455 RepID=UPI002B1E2819|nr:adhesion G protein-coupled receptor F4 isoform X3 [Entelurus aequoreus]
MLTSCPAHLFCRSTSFVSVLQRLYFVFQRTSFEFSPAGAAVFVGSLLSVWMLLNAVPLSEASKFSKYCFVSRSTMLATVLLYLIAAFKYSQVLAADKVYIADILLESDEQLQALTIMSVFNTTSDLQVTNVNGTCHKVTLVESQLVAVHLNIKAELTATTWDSNKTGQVQTAFGGLNGFQHFKITPLRVYPAFRPIVAEIGSSAPRDPKGNKRRSNRSADFQAVLGCKCQTAKLQQLVSTLETSLGAVIQVHTAGMVTLESAEALVPYMSAPMLKCTFEEMSSGASWKMFGSNDCFELRDGSVVKVDSSCATKEKKSCIVLRLQNITNIWTGTYECGFTVGSIRHTARTHLGVAPLPEHISMKATPSTVDCSNRPSSDIVPVSVTATVQYHNSYQVYWRYKTSRCNTSSGDSLHDGCKIEDSLHDGYKMEDSLQDGYKMAISCQKSREAHFVTVTFKNIKEQEKRARLDIPVIYEGELFCKEDEDLWPNTPDGDTVIKHTCPDGRLGYQSRTCQDNTWQPVFSSCVSKHLLATLEAAQRFIMGLVSSQEAAVDIFEGLRNSSMSDGDSSGKMADLMASIHVLDVMADASESIVLQDNVLPDFINAASNLLEQTWDGVNDSIIHDMSSRYLRSVEGLVKNIRINGNKELSTHNLELKLCPGGNCRLTLFDCTLHLTTLSWVKTVAVKNLTDKLRNNFPNTTPSPVLISATLENAEESPVTIRLDFSKKQQRSPELLCVFWNTVERRWSEEGCVVRRDFDGHRSCLCDHLTPFSSLVALSNTSTESLDVLTTVGLSVSVCALLVFLLSEFAVWSAVVTTNLSHIRHTVMVNIALFLLLAHSTFLASSSLELPDEWCRIMAVSKHLFFLATFAWMLCLSVVLIHQLLLVFRPPRKRLFHVLFGIVGYVCPVIIVGCSYCYCKYTDEPYFDHRCWLVSTAPFQGSLYAFLFPVGAITLTNLFCVVVVIVTLLKSQVPEGSKETAKSILRVLVLLTPVFGLTWLPGFSLHTMDADDRLFLLTAYSFTILNSFQGLSILLTGCFADQKVREELWKIFKKDKKRAEKFNNKLEGKI